MFPSVTVTDMHDLNYLDTVYNGLDEQQFHFRQGKGDYLLYFGQDSSA